MSINWVMLSPSSSPPYTPLPHERTLFTSSPRINLAISTPAQHPGKQQVPYSLSSPSGHLYLTNRRIIFLPDKGTPALQSFAAPLSNLHDSHVTAPWFGPNVWTALLQPTSGGGIPIPSTGVVEIRLTFKEGGAFDFHAQYERIRERLQQALEVSRLDVGRDGSNNSNISSHRAGHAISATVDLSSVDLDELPAYQERGDGPLMPPLPLSQQPQPVHHGNVGTGASRQASHPSVGGGEGRGDDANASKATNGVSTPAEPPPRYEDAQIAGLQDEVERRLGEDQQQ